MMICGCDDFEDIANALRVASLMQYAVCGGVEGFMFLPRAVSKPKF